jgi:hypothetical protein
MAIYVYNTTTGALVSYCPNDTDPVASAQVLTANGLTAVTGLPQLGPTVAWDPVGKTTQTVVAPTPANVIHTFDFLMAFTATELAAIRASADNNVQQFLFALTVTQGVNLNAASITNALTYLVNHSLLTAPRATAILATLASNAASGN